MLLFNFTQKSSFAHFLLLVWSLNTFGCAQNYLPTFLQKIPLKMQHYFNALIPHTQQYAPWKLKLHKTSFFGFTQSPSSSACNDCIHKDSLLPTIIPCSTLNELGSELFSDNFNFPKRFNPTKKPEIYEKQNEAHIETAPIKPICWRYQPHVCKNRITLFFKDLTTTGITFMHFTVHPNNPFNLLTIKPYTYQTLQGGEVSAHYYVEAPIGKTFSNT